MYRSELRVSGILFPYRKLPSAEYDLQAHDSRDHIKELNNQRPSTPFFFLKPPSSLLPPNSGPILRPSGVTLHYEVELALLIGKPLSNLAADDEKGAFEAISHYLLAIDMTGRNVQDDAKKKGLPWSIAKGFDTFCPISEPVSRLTLSKEKLQEVYDVELWLDVNGKNRQKDKCELMLFKIPRILSEISGVMALEPGDLVLTGTPKGVGAVTSGDLLEAGIRIGGKEVQEAAMKVDVQDRRGGFAFVP